MLLPRRMRAWRPASCRRNPRSIRALVRLAFFAIILNPSNREVDIVTILSVAAAAEKVNPQKWAATILQVPLRAMAASETVHLIPPPRIRGLDTGSNGTRDTVEMEKTRRSGILMLPKGTSPHFFCRCTHGIFVPFKRTAPPPLIE